MSIGMLGKKVGMTQIFNNRGVSIPVTLLEIGPCTVTQIKKEVMNTKTKVQIGYEYVNPNKLTKARLGHFQKHSIPCFKYLKEYEATDSDTIKLGQILDIEVFKIGSYVTVSGISIGKGFSGYQKRHHFKRGPMSHGSKNHRQPGSIGAGTTPGRVFPGKRMAGQMGNTKVSIKNLEVISLNKDSNIMAIRGSVPGKKGNLIYIHTK
uniref:Large ribosomal subunit protein uL3c n=1 Tax=Chondria sp. (in: red algae) TaxID=1982705 RepID=A0A1Z1MCE3_9FLOR|nr:ribosomal protein L3 [Chondria sp. (in: red algae)]